MLPTDESPILVVALDRRTAERWAETVPDGYSVRTAVDRNRVRVSLSETGVLVVDGDLPSADALRTTARRRDHQVVVIGADRDRVARGRLSRPVDAPALREAVDRAANRAAYTRLVDAHLTAVRGGAPPGGSAEPLRRRAASLAAELDGDDFEALFADLVGQSS